MIFLIVFLLLLLFALYMFVRIAQRTFKPLKTLNHKVSILWANNEELNIDNTTENMTSFEILSMYESFSELITAKRFAANNFYKNNDALAIMDYAEAHTVFEQNKKIQGIWLNNIGHIYHKNKDYDKASKSYRSSASCALDLINENSEGEDIDENNYLYWKRKYYEIVTMLKHCASQVSSQKILFFNSIFLDQGPKSKFCRKQDNWYPARHWIRKTIVNRKV